MIELTEHQRRALDGPEHPVAVVDPATGHEYFLVRREVYERLQAAVRPIEKVWDDPALDVYEAFRKKA